ncbi:MAG: hypothetical protein LBV42_05985 [Methanobrevibacter sp.]|jgi:hypothetical protein|nr:hypothetical protein [Methanobrevibacter sp.]
MSLKKILSVLLIALLAMSTMGSVAAISYEYYLNMGERDTFELHDWMDNYGINWLFTMHFAKAFKGSDFFSVREVPSFDSKCYITAIKKGQGKLTVKEDWPFDDDYVNFEIRPLYRNTAFNLPEKYVHGDLLTGNISLNSDRNELKGDNWNVSAEVSLLRYKGSPRYDPWETIKTGSATFNKVSDNDITGYLSIGDLNWTCPDGSNFAYGIKIGSTDVFDYHSHKYAFNVYN